MIVKICGLRTVEHTLVAATAGADLLGLVFAPSRRQVTLTEAATIAAAVHKLPAPRPRLVGLFVHEQPARIKTIVQQVGLDLVQLSGDEPVSDAAAITVPIIKAIRMDGSQHEADWLQQPVTFLVDAHVPGSYGGTGVRADWARAAPLASQRPLLLAGGLNAANVAAAIAAVRPLGVDVSSGVERDGRKDALLIETFIAAARCTPV
jgi:phosphoribosylanthranilate isomerase